MMAEQFDSARLLTLENALKQLPGLGGKRFAEVFRHGSLQIEIYAPIEQDSQTHATRLMS